ncbi:MAG: carboxypeptidase regulatory-like domain-containing protein, partial [Acidobacteriaceae bacterium]|nr:carboxypeptidase regulatory-like domain-containing protein [Acidobacteriaceae bacterium]
MKIKQNKTTKPGRSIAIFFALLFVLSGFSGRLMAQTTSSLSGTVQDGTGAIIPGARVVLTNTATNEIRRLETNSSGYFNFAGIVPGSYTVAITAEGFRGYQQQNVVLNPGDTRSLPNRVLSPGAATETVT